MAVNIGVSVTYDINIVYVTVGLMAINIIHRKLDGIDRDDPSGTLIGLTVTCISRMLNRVYTFLSLNYHVGTSLNKRFSGTN
jgi:hypothetical protein